MKAVTWQGRRDPQIFGKQPELSTGQADVRRSRADILRLLEDETDQLGKVDFTT